MPGRSSSSESSSKSSGACERGPDEELALTLMLELGLDLSLGNLALRGVLRRSIGWNDEAVGSRAAFGVDDIGRLCPGFDCGRIEGELDVDSSKLYPPGKLGVGRSLESSKSCPAFPSICISLSLLSFFSNGDSILLSQLSLPIPVYCFLASGVDAVAP